MRTWKRSWQRRQPRPELRASPSIFAWELDGPRTQELPVSLSLPAVARGGTLTSREVVRVEHANRRYATCGGQRDLRSQRALAQRCTSTSLSDHAVRNITSSRSH